MSESPSAWMKLQRLRAELKTYFKQRDEVVDGALVALLAGVHVLLLGPPGTAKSLLARTLCQHLDGARFFECVLNKFLTWRDLACTGVQVHEQEQEGVKLIDFRYRESALLRAVIIFLDEIYKLSGPALNSLLSLLNERTYSINAGEVKKAPLLAAFAASNEMPTESDEQLHAFSDRLLLRYEVAYLSVSQGSDTAFVGMLLKRDPPPETTLTLAELDGLRAQADQVGLDQSIVWLVNSIRATMKCQHGLEPSDRRYDEATRAVKAYAFLNGHAAVQPQDLLILEHILWTRRDRKEQDTVRQVVREAIGAPGLSVATALLEEAGRIAREALALLDEAGRTIPFDEARRQARDGKLRDAAARERRLEEICRELDGQVSEASDRASTANLRTIRNEVNVLRKSLVQKRGVENPFLEVDRWTGRQGA